MRAATTADTRHVSLVAIPDAVASTLFGLYDALNAFRMMGMDGTRPFHVEIVGEKAGMLELASHVPVKVERAIAQVAETDIVLLPSILLRGDHWQHGRYPELVAWSRHMHDRGALLCSACSGIFVLAETGAFDGHDATVHFGYQRAFAQAFPSIVTHVERPLVVSGRREELVCSGASTSWHDLVLYLISRYAGAAAAQEVARMFALQWHVEGLAPYITFHGKTDHGDGEIRAAQDWLARHFAVANPVDEMVKRSRLAERTFKRRFVAAAGIPPIAYVQRLRVEDAKRRLERTDASIDEISWRVGYEDGAFFRRLFKRVTGMAPGAYRKKFRLPKFAAP